MKSLVDGANIPYLEQN